MPGSGPIIALLERTLIPLQRHLGSKPGIHQCIFFLFTKLAIVVSFRVTEMLGTMVSGYLLPPGEGVIPLRLTAFHEGRYKISQVGKNLPGCLAFCMATHFLQSQRQKGMISSAHTATSLIVRYTLREPSGARFDKCHFEYAAHHPPNEVPSRFSHLHSGCNLKYSWCSSFPSRDDRRYLWRNGSPAGVRLQSKALGQRHCFLTAAKHNRCFASFC